MTLLLTQRRGRAALNMRDCIDVLERAYPELGDGIGVSRTVSQIFTPTPHSPDALYSFKSMDGVAPFAGVAAIRLTSEILTWPKDASGRAKKVRIGAAPNGRFIGLVLLFSTTTGEPLAIFPDGVCSACASGHHRAAPRNISRARTRGGCDARLRLAGGAQILAIARGARRRARALLQPECRARAAFAQEMRGKTGLEVVASDSGPEAVRGADVVLCATNSWSPVFLADWIEPGMHI